MEGIVGRDSRQPLLHCPAEHERRILLVVDRDHYGRNVLMGELWVSRRNVPFDPVKVLLAERGVERPPGVRDVYTVRTHTKRHPMVPHSSHKDCRLASLAGPSQMPSELSERIGRKEAAHETAGGAFLRDKHVWIIGNKHGRLAGVQRDVASRAQSRQRRPLVGFLCGPIGKLRGDRGQGCSGRRCAKGKRLEVSREDACIKDGKKPAGAVVATLCGGSETAQSHTVHLGVEQERPFGKDLCPAKVVCHRHIVCSHQQRGSTSGLVDEC